MSELSRITGGNLSKLVGTNSSSSFTSSFASFDSDAVSIAEYALSMARISATGSEEADGSDTIDFYSIAASTAVDRVGLVVYMTESFATVDLAAGALKDKMPAIGIISHDRDVTVGVRSLSGLVSDVKVDSDADVETGDKIFMSVVETGKVSNIPPEDFGVVQSVGIAKSDPINSKISIMWDPKIAIYL